MTTHLTSEQAAAYHCDGYVIARAFFDSEDMRILQTYARADPILQQSAFLRADTQGGAAKMALWNEAGDDLYGIVSRTSKLADTAEQLLGAEPYRTVLLTTTGHDFYQIDRHADGRLEMSRPELDTTELHLSQS